MSAALLAACGGGGSSPAPAPTPKFAERPAAVGDAFDYSGTMTEAFVRPPLPAGEITPDPNPTNSATIVTAVTQAVSVVSGSAFDGVTAPFDFHTVESDTVNGGLESTTSQSDNYYSYVASGTSTDISFLGSVTSDEAGDTFDTTIGSGNGLVDIVPEVTGAIGPANTAAQTTVENDADGATLTRTTAANGTYTETGYQLAFAPDDTAISATLNLDGSGSYTAPAIAPEDVTYKVGAPEPNPSGGPDVIPLTLIVPTNLDGNPSPGPTPDTIVEAPIPVWYPQPLVISNQSLVNEGVTSLPSACNVPASLTKSANAIVQATTTIDPVFGEIDVNTTTAYTEEHIGVACTTLHDVVSQYYDLSGQAQEALFSFGSTPQQVTTTTETLGLTTATVETASVRERATAVAFRASVGQFRAVLAKHRTQRRAAFYRAFAARMRKGVHR